MTASVRESYDIKVENEALSLSKKANAKANFDDGVVFDIAGKAQPRHLQFYCKVQGTEAEGCDIRLAKRLNSDFSWAK